MSTTRQICWLLVLAVAPLYAKAPPAAGDARAILAANAKALEARGRADMAIELWRQMLLSDPDNTDALAGLARDYKLTGSSIQANEAQVHLQQVSENRPLVQKPLVQKPVVEKLKQQGSPRDSETAQRHRAEDLERQGHSDDAMRIYRQLYGDHPPDDVAPAYYLSLYGTGKADAKQQAIAALRALAQHSPGGGRFAVELGAMLTRDAATRGEGMHILEMHPHDAHAQAALRQALMHDAGNPASAADLRAYLRDHPGDTELAGYLKGSESKLTQTGGGAQSQLAAQ